MAAVMLHGEGLPVANRGRGAARRDSIAPAALKGGQE
uniref:Uncharacterized protein n=1 Tax=Arundo donax TaxID=35708 RepID=A0A0A8ZEC5_ARUDO